MAAPSQNTDILALLRSLTALPNGQLPSEAAPALKMPGQAWSGAMDTLGINPDLFQSYRDRTDPSSKQFAMDPTTMTLGWLLRHVGQGMVDTPQQLVDSSYKLLQNQNPDFFDYLNVADAAANASPIGAALPPVAPGVKMAAGMLPVLGALVKFDSGGAKAVARNAGDVLPGLEALLGPKFKSWAKAITEGGAGRYLTETERPTLQSLIPDTAEATKWPEIVKYAKNRSKGSTGLSQLIGDDSMYDALGAYHPETGSLWMGMADQPETATHESIHALQDLLSQSDGGRSGYNSIVGKMVNGKFQYVDERSPYRKARDSARDMASVYAKTKVTPYNIGPDEIVAYLLSQRLLGKGIQIPPEGQLKSWTTGSIGPKPGESMESWVNGILDQWQALLPEVGGTASKSFPAAKTGRGGLSDMLRQAAILEPPPTPLTQATKRGPEWLEGLTLKEFRQKYPDRFTVHGTPVTYGLGDPAKVSQTGWKGAGQYSSDAPPVTSDYSFGASSGFDASGAAKDAADAQKYVDQYTAELSDTLAQPEVDQEAVAWLRNELKDWQEELTWRTERLGHLVDIHDMAPQSRPAVTPPRTFEPNLTGADTGKFHVLDLSKDWNTDWNPRVQEWLDARYPGNPVDMSLYDYWPGTADEMWEELAAILERTDKSGGYTDPLRAQMLHDLGFDALQHPGGTLQPLYDAAGNPIKHTVTVTLPQSLMKLRNALSGAQGGQANALGAAGMGGAAGLFLLLQQLLGQSGQNGNTETP